jgi:trehalose 6-phosphate phosphatase
MDGESGAFDSVVRRCVDVLRARPSGLLSDIDGTISLIAATPDAAYVEEVAKTALIELSDLLDVVGAVTGRAAENAERMLTIPRLVYIGNHGLEHRQDGVTEIHSEAVFAVGAIAEALQAIREEAISHHLEDGVLYENKGVSGSIHYRLASDQQIAHDILLPIVQRAAGVRALRVVEGRMVIELRPAIAVNKGTALRSVVDRFDLNGLIFLGDDRTDIDGFLAIRELRGDRQFRGLNIAVVAPESLPDVALEADVVIQGVASCAQLLASVAQVLKEENANV